MADDAVALARAARAFNPVGLVGVADPGLYAHELRAYQVARERGALTVRAGLCPAGWGWSSAAWDARVAE